MKRLPKKEGSAGDLLHNRSKRGGDTQRNLLPFSPPVLQQHQKKEKKEKKKKREKKNANSVNSTYTDVIYEDVSLEQQGIL